MAFSINRVIEYFDLSSRVRPSQNHHGKAEKDEKSFHWLPQYFALLLGILVQPFFQQYMNTGQWNLEKFGGWFFASLIIAFMAFPTIYKNSLDPKKPIFVQFRVIFTTGIGRQTLVNSAIKGAGVNLP